MHKTFGNLASDLSITTLHMFVFVLQCEVGKPLITCPVCLFYVASCIFVASSDDYCNAGHSSPPGNRL